MTSVSKRKRNRDLVRENGWENGWKAIQVLVCWLRECLKPHDPKRGFTIESPDFVDFVGNFNPIVWMRAAIYSFPQLLWKFYFVGPIDSLRSVSQLDYKPHFIGVPFTSLPDERPNEGNRWQEQTIGVWHNP